VLDTSGSTGAYADLSQSRQTKLEVARDTLTYIVCDSGLLWEKDKVGVITTNRSAGTEVLQEIVEWSSLDKLSFQKQLQQILPRGKTSVRDGMKKAVELQENDLHNDALLGSRLFVFTDMHLSEEEEKAVKARKRNTDHSHARRLHSDECHQDHLDNAEPEKGKNQETYVDFARWLAEEKSLNTTFFGIGSDIRTEALPQLARIPGCSYFGLSIAKENREVLLLQQFEYKVHPAASKVCLELHQSPFEAEAEQTCGGEPVTQDGQFFYQDALYPSASSAQGIQGSMILLKLRKRAASKNGWREEQPTTRMAAHLSHTCCNRLFCPHNGPSEPTAPQHSSALLMTAYDAGSHCIM